MVKCYRNIHTWDSGTEMGQKWDTSNQHIKRFIEICPIVPCNFIRNSINIFKKGEYTCN